MRKECRVFAMSVIAFACASSAFAATPVNLNHQSPDVLQTFQTLNSSLKQTRATIDFKKVSHVHVQQTYNGYRVWGGDAILHIANQPNANLKTALAANKASLTMNGVLYKNLDADLASAPNYVFNKDQADRAIQKAIDTYQQKIGMKNSAQNTKAELMVFIDNGNKAHWAYLVTFDTQAKAGEPAKPTFILDAVSFDNYQYWDNIQTAKVLYENDNGGGFGGNEKMGEYSYDSLGADLPELSIERDVDAKICYLENNDVTVKDISKGNAVVQFACDETDGSHNGIYWDADFDKVNGGYSPSNDALFVGKVIKEMYQNWYGIPVLTENGKPMMLNMRVHQRNYDNAYWDGQQMTFGDGYLKFYPLVSLGVGAHEISHGFTQQHSGLAYYGQSGGMNEAFSDMAAQAAEFYAYGHNSWQIGPEIFKKPDEALRYMDQPSKDCHGGKPGRGCSIDTAKQYNNNLDVHYSSGVFNHLFYLLGTANNWDTRKAFDVMVKANMDYWTPNSTFAEAACGVVKAAKDYNYDMDGVAAAMAGVEIDVSSC